MSHRTCTAPRPAPLAVLGPGAVPLTLRPRPVPLVLGLVLALLLWVALGDAHLVMARGLAPVLGPSPVPGPGAVQLAKLLILAALASMMLGAVLLALHARHDLHERRLACRFTLTLALGGVASVGLDLMAIIGPIRLPALEALAEAVTFAACTLLLGRHLLRSRRRPSGQRAHAVATESGGAADAGGNGGIGLEPA